MSQPISKEQILKAEQMVQARAAENPEFSNKLRGGKIKFLIEPGDKFSNIVIVDMTNSKNVEKYGGRQMFNSPQEAEHFTAGFGNQPTRDNSAMNFFNRAIRPHYQNTVNDPVRAIRNRGTRDITQDVLSGARYVTPMIAPLFNLPMGPATAGVGAANLGLGLASRALTNDDEPWYQETLPNIATNAAAATASVAGNKYFAEDAVRKRQLKKAVAQKLGIKPDEFDPNLIEDIEKPLKAQTISLPEYTYGDWRKQPLTEFDAKTGAEEKPVTIERPPAVHDNLTAAKVTARKPTVTITDEMATRFLQDLGENRFDANIEDVKKFLRGWTNRLSNEGVTFWPTASMARPTKGQWTKMVKEESNPFTKMMLRKQAAFDDPVMQKQWEDALNQFAIRWQKVKGKTKTPIITPSEYSAMGEYSFKLPFLRSGNSPVKLGFRGPIRAAATLLPLAAQATLPYIIKAAGSNDE